MNRGKASPQREGEQDRLFVWVSDAIAEAMHREGMSKADVARKLGMTRANVTALLSGRRNLTLKSMADMAWAANARFKVDVVPLEPGRSRTERSAGDVDSADNANGAPKRRRA